MSVVIETTLGDITVDLYLKERPNACLNFLKLCKIKYYNFCVFYKVERNFIAQTGDPSSTGRGGHSVFSLLYGDQATYFDAESKPRLKHEKIGTLSMVNNGNNMHGSQFFLTLGENLTYLDETHTVFGEVAEGFDILLKINEAICDPNNRPYQDIRITHTVVLHDPYDDPPGLEIPDASPLPTKEMLESDYIAPDEEIDDTKGKTEEEIEEKIKESEAKARATILEMVGDIPDADVKPPENVLFVCKLNPVTTAEDLEIIFSRFGVIVSCEVIKDQKTGESLQYAFIEFEKEEDCENAYFKMDNVLIDDRRIHVDFSQSVSKLNWNQGKAGGPGKGSRFQNFVIKGSEKKSDGYEMIFDVEKSTSNREEKRKHENRSSDDRQKRYDSHKKDDRYKKLYSYHEDRNSEHNKRNFDKKQKRSSPDYYKSRRVSPDVRVCEPSKYKTQERNYSASKSPEPFKTKRKIQESSYPVKSSKYPSDSSRSHKSRRGSSSSKSPEPLSKRQKSKELFHHKKSSDYSFDSSGRQHSRRSESSSKSPEPSNKMQRGKESLYRSKSSKYSEPLNRRESASISPELRKKSKTKESSQSSKPFKYSDSFERQRSGQESSLNSLQRLSEKHKLKESSYRSKSSKHRSDPEERREYRTDSPEVIKHKNRKSSKSSKRRSRSISQNRYESESPISDKRNSKSSSGLKPTKYRVRTPSPKNRNTKETSYRSSSSPDSRLDTKHRSRNFSQSPDKSRLSKSDKYSRKTDSYTNSKYKKELIKSSHISKSSSESDSDTNYKTSKVKKHYKDSKVVSHKKRKQRRDSSD